MPRLALLPVVLLALSCDPTARTGARSCLKSRGCPESTPAPACPPGLEARPVAEVLGAPEALLGQPVAVRGLAAVDGVCTLLGCDGCCNRCDGGYRIGSATPGEHKRITLHGDGLSCAGDESLMCCGVTASGDVIAQGTLSSANGEYQLEGATLCVPGR